MLQANVSSGFCLAVRIREETYHFVDSLEASVSCSCCFRDLHKIVPEMISGNDG